MPPNRLIFDGVEGDEQNIFSRFVSHVQNTPDQNVLCFLEDGDVHGKKINLTWKQLYVRVTKCASLIQRKSDIGDRVALLFLNPIDFMSVFLACMGLRRIAVPIAPPSFSTIERDKERIKTILEDCTPSLICTEELFVPIQTYVKTWNPNIFISNITTIKKNVGTTEQFLTSDVFFTTKYSMEDTVMLQYTSGSTSSPKGVMLSHKNLNHNLAGMKIAFEVTSQSIFFSWLPLFHDYGLIATVLTSIWTGSYCILMLPMHFMQDPSRWFKGISFFRATHSSAPNFAYALCSQKIQVQQLLEQKVDLSCWKMAGLGGETIQASTLKDFFATFEILGFLYKSFHPQYGLAESTVGVACKSNMHVPPTICSIHKSAFVQGFFEEDFQVATSKNIVGVGRTWLGTQLEIRNPTTQKTVSSGEIGEIWLCSPSVSSGYWNKSSSNFTTDGWLRTGDLGVLHKGEVFVCGRNKEMILFHGQNYWPQDIEIVIATHCSSIKKGGICVVQDREENIFVVCEVDTSKHPKFSKISREIIHLLSTHFRIKATKIILVKPRSVLKTTSGKIQRKATLSSIQSTQTASVLFEQLVQDEIDLFQLAQSIIVEEHNTILEKDTSFSEMGLDSLQMVELSVHLSNIVQREISVEILFSHPTPQKIRNHIQLHKKNIEIPNTNTVNSNILREHTDTIAIVGIGCILPKNIEHVDDFWSALLQGKNFVDGDLNERWKSYGFPYVLEEGYAKAALLSHDIFDFDADLFSLSDNEILYMDPQQRLALEVSWLALESAHMAVDTLQEQDMGVFFASGPSEYSLTTMNSTKDQSVYSGSGVHAAAISGRISYLLGLRGQSMTVDTACSSSLMALHLACQSIQSGDCSSAIVGGVNLILRPESSIYFSTIGALSPSGHSRSFSKDADGYVRGEGGVAVVLKNYKKALEDEDEILCTIRATASNHDGRSNGFTAPSGVAQKELYQKTLQKAGIDPNKVVYIESHGTGTKLGDAIEIASIAEVYGKENPIVLGAVKSHIGHLEAVAGLVGLIKTIKVLEHQVVPPNLHCDNLSTSVAERTEILIPKEIIPIKGGIAAISSFGFTGSNVHVLLELEKKSKQNARTQKQIPINHMLISANSRESLEANKIHVLQWIQEHPNISLEQLALHLNYSRPLLTYRQSISLDDIKRSLAEQNLYRVQVKSESQNKKQPLPIAFLFSGQGSCYVGMHQCLSVYPTFSEHLVYCHKILGDEFDLLGLLEGSKQGLMESKYTQASLLAFQYALVQLWQSFGIRPQYILGHSVGSYCAAVVAGALSIETALLLLRERGMAMDKIQEGSMLALRCHQTQLDDILQHYQVDLCVINGENRFVVGGDVAEINRLYQDVQSDLSCTILSVQRAFHSSHMQKLDKEWLSCIPNKPNPKIVSDLVWISDIDGKQINSIADVDWYEHATKKIDFSSAIQSLLQKTTKMLCLEIGPQQILTSMISEFSNLHSISSQRNQTPSHFDDVLQKLFVMGFSIRVPKPSPLSIPLTKIYRNRHFRIDQTFDTDKIVSIQPVISTEIDKVISKDWIHAIEISQNENVIWKPILSKKTRFFQNMKCVISGGMGGIGQKLALYLAQNYQANLIVLHRRTQIPKTLREEIQAYGSIVRFERIDFFDDDQSVIKQLDLLPKDIDVLFHLMGSLKGDIHRIKAHSLELLQILKPKSQYLFSSISSIMPSMASGIEEYAQANKYLNDFAIQKHRLYQQNRSDHHIQSICWGPWSEIGMGAQHEEEWKKRGILSVSPSVGFHFLEEISGTDDPLVAVFYRPQEQSNPKISRDSILDFLCQIVSNTAKIDPSDIDIHQDFTSMGIDSLMALDMLKEIEQFLGQSLPTSLIYEHFTIAALSKILSSDIDTVVEKTKYISLKENLVGYPLLPAQETFVIQHQFFTDLSCNVSLALSFYDKNQKPFLFQKSLLDEILGQLLLRHPILTGVFQIQEKQYRMVLGKVPIQSEEIDDLDREQEVVQERLHLFEGPLFRCLFCKNRLILIGHHAIIDAWSIKNIFEEILLYIRAYQREGIENFVHVLPSLDSGWEDVLAHADAPSHPKHVDYWKEKLQNGVPPIHLSWQQSIQTPSSGSIKQVRRILPKIQTDGILEMATKHSVTIVCLVLAAYKKMLFDHSGQDVVTVRVAKGNREIRIPDCNKLVGSFADSIPVITTFQQNMSLGEMAQCVQKSLTESLLHGDISSVDLAKMGEFKSCGPSGLTPFGFSFPNMPVLFEDTDLIIRDCRGYAGGGFSRLTLLAWMFEGELCLTLSYVTSHLSQKQTEAFADEILWSLQNCELRQQSEQIQFQIIKRCQKHPKRLAVGQMTYGELNRCSAFLAQKLYGDRIAILGVPSEEAAIAILAVLRSGKTWIPLDPRWPEERIHQVLESAKPSLLLTTKEYQQHIHNPKESPIVLITKEQMTDTESHSVESGDIAYIMYTSGSTGIPKGVVVRHPALLQWLGWVQRMFEVNSTDIFSWSSSLSFGGSLRQLFSPLQQGGQSIPIHPQVLRNPSLLLDCIEENQITNFNSVPSLLSLLLDEMKRSNRKQALDSIRNVLVGGEAFGVDVLQKWFQIVSSNIRIFNVYGSTETIVNATAYEIIGPPQPQDLYVPIGWARSGCRISLQNVEDGIGEIAVTGLIAEGYWNNTVETQRVFSKEETSNETTYLMGDIGKFLKDGSLIYLGRRDSQVQIYGNRVELSEIETRLLSHPHIRECAVLYENSLIAYLSVHQSIEPQELRQYVQSYLPDYMIPHKWIFLEKLPRNTAGKIVRSDLSQASLLSVNVKSNHSPIVENQISKELELLLGLCQHVLELDYLPQPTDNFFTLGGDSIRVLQLQKYLEEQGYALNPMSIYTYQELESLALVLHKKESHVDYYRDVTHTELSMVQRGFWTFHQLHPKNPPIWVSQLPIQGNIEPPLIQNAIQILVQRHESLRCAFVQKTNRPERFVYDKFMPQLQYDDISMFSVEKQAQFLDLFWRMEKEVPFELDSLPLFRVRLTKTAQDRFVFCFSVHHIIADAWSSWVLISEMLQIHEQLRHGQNINLLPTVPFSSVPEPLQDDDWWDEYLRNLPLIPSLQSKNRYETHLQISLEHWNKLVQRARMEHCTPFVLVLYALFDSLQQVLGQTDVSISTAIAGREHELHRLSNVVGPFARALPIRIQKQASILLVKDQIQQVSQHSQASLSSIAKACGSQGVMTLSKFFFSWMDPSIVFPPEDNHQILWSKGRFSYDTTSTETEMMIGALVHEGIRLNISGLEERISKIAPLLEQRILQLCSPTSSLVVYAPKGFPIPKGMGPVLVETIYSSYGIMEVIAIPRTADNLGGREELIPLIQKAAGLTSGHVIALAGMLPALTGLCLDNFLDKKQLSTGHAVTVVAMFLNIKSIIDSFALRWSDLHVGVVGYGSIGTACMELLQRELGTPFEITIEDPKLGRDNAQKLLECDLIIGASSGGLSIDVHTLSSGTILVDDSFPSIFDPQKALERMKSDCDVLILGGGTLDIGTLQRHSPFPQAQELRKILGSLYLPGCQAEAILLALQPHLDVTRGVVTYDRAKEILDEVQQLGWLAPPPHLGGYIIEKYILERFHTMLRRQ